MFALLILTLLLSAYPLRLGMYSQRSDPFIVIIMKTLSLSLVMLFVLQSALSQINISTPSFFWFIFLHCIASHLSVSLYLRGVSCSTRIIYFLNIKLGLLKKSTL